MNNFNEYGLLNPGTYALTLGQLRESILVTGGWQPPEGWDAEWRYDLVDGLEEMVKQLWKVGYDQIFIDGSFVEDKGTPGDIDGYFEAPWMDFLERGRPTLNEIEPIWTWNPQFRRPHLDSPTKRQLPMWHRYRVELYPHYTQVPDEYKDEANLSGITDLGGKNLPFPQAFRQQRETYLQKGIIKIIR
ncbi:hypothetical protein C8P63_12427 [Melghirimyces profundicolus]|uniref:Uncharacterized protein n=1 Tax=Melghirimyces profundicolus TaxID=1242148 RepID=A0A2T6BD19_9BACL|nr:hypothetical protein [Melghirimyces profundicolus]PTX53971.1 hypothetical protein C8P63_12427 [Melghirimyces profundicolus]